MPSESKNLDERILEKQIRLKQQQLASRTKADTSPIEGPTPTPPRATGPYADFLASKNAPLPTTPGREQERQLMEEGVDITTGADAGRFGASFAANEQFAKQYLQKKLTERFSDSLKEGQRVNLRTGPTSGKIEFLNPETKRWTLIDEVAFSTEDLKDIAGPAIPFAGEIGGATAGFLAGASTGPGAVATAAGGAGIGGGAGEAARLEIGRRMGVNPGLEGGDIADQSLEVGGKAALGTGIGEGLFRFGKYLFGSRTPFSPGQAESLLRESQTSNEVINEINERIKGDFNPTLGQRTGVGEVLDKEASLERGVDLTDARRILGENKQANISELERFYETISPTGEAGRSGTGRRIEQTFQEGEEQALADARGIERSTRDLVDVEAEDIRALDAPLAGKEIREGLVELRDKADRLETDLWKDVETRAGYSPDTASSNIQIPRSDDLDRTVRTLSTEARKALTEGEARGKKSLISRLVEKDEDSIKILDHNGQVMSEISTSGEPIDLVQVNSAISQLRRQIRVSSKGLSSEDPSVGDAKRLLKSLVRTRNEYLAKNDPELLGAIKDAEMATRAKNRLFNRSIASRYLRETEDGDFVIDDAGVFNSIFARNNGQAARELGAILNANPQAMQATREHIYSLYKSTVFQNGVPDPKLHRKFMDEYEDVISPFFTKGDMDRVRKFGRFGELVERRANELENLEKALNARLPGKVKKLNSENIVDAIFGGGKTESGATTLNIDDVKKLRRILDVGPKGLLEDTQRVFRDEISRRIRTNGVLDAEKLGNLLDKQGDKIAALGGPQYRADLKKLLSGLRMVERQGEALSKGAEPTLIQFLRSSVLRPLSRAQRRITFGSKLNISHTEAALLEAVTDPDVLHALTMNMNKKLSGKNVAGILGALELSGVADPIINGNAADQ